jgi:EmrB/QacA subfamily drug resistance transporter
MAAPGLAGVAKSFAWSAKEMEFRLEVEVLKEPVRFGTPAGRWVIAGMVLGSAATFVSATVVNVALPSIGEDLGVQFGGLQWIINGYLLTLSALVLLAGSAGDIYGRRRMFLWGCTVFGVASLLCAVSPNITWLVVARMLQGLGAAAMTPASLAIVDASFHPDDKSRAIGSWAGGSALASAAGPFVGGWLVDVFSWRWVFLVVLPLLAGGVFATLRHVPESRDNTAGRHLDYPGAGSGALAVAGLAYVLTQGPRDGWTNTIVVLAAAITAASTILFALIERSRRDPMLPFPLFTSTQFSGANLVTLLMYFAIGGVMFFTALAFQTIGGYSALQAGAALVPASIIMILGSGYSGQLSAKYGPRWLVTVGPLLVAVATVLLAQVDADSRYLIDILPAALLLGVGFATFVPPLTASVMAAVPPHEVGIGSAINNAVARTAGLLATAVVPLVAGVSGTLDAQGYQRGLLLCAVLAVIAAVIGAATIGRCVATHTPQQAVPLAGCLQRSLPTREQT